MYLDFSRYLQKCEAMADWTCHQVSATFGKTFGQLSNFAAHLCLILKIEISQKNPSKRQAIIQRFISYNLRLCYLVAFVSLIIQMRAKHKHSPFNIIALWEIYKLPLN